MLKCAVKSRGATDFVRIGANLYGRIARFYYGLVRGAHCDSKETKNPAELRCYFPQKVARAVCCLLTNISSRGLGFRIRVRRACLRGVGPRAALCRDDPDARYTPATGECRRLKAWSNRLTDTDGAALLLALGANRVPQWTSHKLVLVMSSDAARSIDSDPHRGLGAYCHGACVRVILPPLIASIVPIGLLELLAAFMALLTFAPLILQTGVALLDTDSLSVDFQLTDESARTPWGQWLISRISNEPSFQETRSLTGVRHVWGPTNIFSDVLSRNEGRKLRLLAAQMNVRLFEYRPPPTFAALLSDFVHLVHQSFEPQVRPSLTLLSPPLHEPLFPELRDAPQSLQRFPPVGTAVQTEEPDPVHGTSSASALPQEIIQYMDSEERALSDKLLAPLAQLSVLQRDESIQQLAGWLLSAPVSSRHLPYAYHRVSECNELTVLASEQQLNQFCATSSQRRALMNAWARNNLPTDLWSFYKDDLEFPTQSENERIARLDARDTSYLDERGVSPPVGVMPAWALDILQKQHALRRVREVTQPTRMAIEAEQERAQVIRSQLSSYKGWLQHSQPLAYQLGQLLTHMSLVQDACAASVADEPVGIEKALGVYYLDMGLLSHRTEADITNGRLTRAHIRRPEARFVRPIHPPVPTVCFLVEHESANSMVDFGTLPAADTVTRPFEWFELPIVTTEDRHPFALRDWLGTAVASIEDWARGAQSIRARLRTLARAQERMMHLLADKYNARLADQRRLRLTAESLLMHAHEHDELAWVQAELLRVGKLAERLQVWRSDTLRSEHLAASLEEVLRGMARGVTMQHAGTDHLGEDAEWMSCFGTPMAPPSQPMRVSRDEYTSVHDESSSDDELHELATTADTLLQPKLGFVSRRCDQTGVNVHDLARRWPSTPTDWRAAPPSPHNLATAAVLPHIVQNVLAHASLPFVEPRRVRPRVAPPVHPVADVRSTSLTPVSAGGHDAQAVDALPTAFPMLQSTLGSAIHDLGSLARLSAANAPVVTRVIGSLTSLQRHVFDWAGGFTESTASLHGVDPAARRMAGRIPPHPHVIFGDTERHDAVRHELHSTVTAAQDGATSRGERADVAGHGGCLDAHPGSSPPSPPSSEHGDAPAEIPDWCHTSLDDSELRLPWSVPTPSSDSPRDAPSVELRGNRGLYEVEHRIWAADIGGFRTLIVNDGRILPLQVLAFEECYACWAHHHLHLEEEWAFASSPQRVWDCRVRLARLALLMLNRVLPHAPPLSVFPDDLPTSLRVLPANARDVLEFVGYYEHCGLQHDVLHNAPLTLADVIPMIAPFVIALHPLCLSRHTTRVLSAAIDARSVPTRAVVARSHHATSVHLGLAADATAQADHRMADQAAPAESRVALFDNAIAQLGVQRTPTTRLAHNSAAWCLARLIRERTVRSAGIRAIQAVVNEWHFPCRFHLIRERCETYNVSKRNFMWWRKRLLALRDEIESERLQETLDALMGDDAEGLLQFFPAGPAPSPPALLPPPSLPPSPSSSPPPSPSPSPAPHYGANASLLASSPDDWVCVRVVRELGPSTYSSHSQSFSFHYATL